MPYYRIVLLLANKKKPIITIRQYEERDIERVQLKLMVKSRDHYGNNFSDIEVQMLSKASTAVKNFLREKHSPSEDLSTDIEIDTTQVKMDGKFERSKPAWKRKGEGSNWGDKFKKNEG